jgi:hypothetical protein
MNNVFGKVKRKQSWYNTRYYSALCVQGPRKTTKTFVTIAGLQEGTYIQDLPNTNQTYYPVDRDVLWSHLKKKKDYISSASVLRYTLVELNMKIEEAKRNLYCVMRSIPLSAKRIHVFSFHKKYYVMKPEFVGTRIFHVDRNKCDS